LCGKIRRLYTSNFGLESSKTQFLSLLDEVIS